MQLLNLLDVVIDYAERKSNPSNEPGASASEQPSDPQVSSTAVEMNVVSTAASGESSSSMQETSSDAVNEQTAESVLNNLPNPELQLLCSLLAREG